MDLVTENEELRRRLNAAEESLREMAASSTAFRESEQRYRTLFGKLGQGFCELELVRGVDERVSDLRYIFVNPAHERLAGIKAEDAVGRTTLQLVPTFDPANFALYDEAVNSGSHVRVEYEVPSLGRWYEVYIYPSSNDHVFVFYEDFTERKRNEQALRESDERQRFLLRLGDAMRSISDPSEVIATASEYLGKHLGLDRCFYGEVDPTAEHITLPGIYCAPGVMPFPGQVRLQDFGKEFLDFIEAGNTLVVDNNATDTRLTDRSHVENLIRAGVAACVGVPLIKRGGLVAILSAHQTQPRSWAASDIALLEEVAERTWAVLERTRAEAALRESEERQRLTIELVPALLWSTSPEGREMSLNERWLAYTGQSEADSQQGGWLAAVHPDDLLETRAAFRHAFATGEPLEREQRIYKAGDGWRWHLVRQVPVTDESGSIMRWFGAAVDIHESKLAQQALERAELRLQTLVEGVPQLVWRAVDGGRWTWASPQWTSYTGQAEPDSHDHGWLEPVHPDDRDRVLAVWEGAIERGEFHVDYRICYQAESRYRWFQTRATPVRDQAGQIVEWLGTSTDVDDLRRLQERQQILLAELQHRVRNILAVTRSIISRSDDGERSTEDYVQHLQGRIATLARTQVLLTRSAGKPVDLQELIRDELIAQAADEGQISLEGEEIAISPKSAEVLTLAIHELATNATKYGAFSRPTGRLEVRWRSEPRNGQRWLVIEWREQGVAIVDAVPRRQGFGSELISRRIPYELKGHGSFTLQPGGLESRIEFPLAAGESILQTDAGAR